jgi:hypothetical protein
MVKSDCFTREHIEKIRSGFTVDNFILSLLDSRHKGIPTHT